MGAIKFLLVLLLCMPIAFLIWRIVNVLTKNLREQQRASEKIRMRKASYQGSDRYERVRRHEKYGRSSVSTEREYRPYRHENAERPERYHSRGRRRDKR